nr:hypothetical protein [Tanacetum cinerariifolium]GFC20843.1 hypothetical protein [Tanacetum cinerariifolium]
MCRWRAQLLEEYPSLIHTFFMTHTVGGVFLNPEDKDLCVLPGHGTVISPPPPCTYSSDVTKLKKSEKRLTKQPEIGGDSGSDGCGNDEPGYDEDGREDEEDADS